MAFRKYNTAALLTALLLGGCSFADDALFPSLTPDGGASSSNNSRPHTSPQTSVIASSISPPKVTEGAPTGTFVGQKVSSLRNDLKQLQGTLATQSGQLQQLRAQTVQDSQMYHGTVAAIEARLQIGTTPGNPVLVQQWNESQGELDRINEDILKMTRLSTDVASTSGLAAYLLESVRAARSLSGAVDEDHRQLRVLEDDTNSTTLLIERLLTELSSDSQRQQQYIAAERSNLNTLAVAIKNGQLYGSALGNVGRLGSATPSFLPSAGSPLPAGVGDRPLVVIRFDKANVSYDNALYTAVKGALDRRPTASFEVVAVSPAGRTPGSAALGETTIRRNADSVVRSLTQMGLPGDRIGVSSATSPTATSGEVQVFVR